MRFLHTPRRIPLGVPSQKRCLSAFQSRGLSSLSFVKGSTEVPLLEETFPEFFAQRLLPDHSENIALVSTHESPAAHGGPRMSSASASAPYLTWTFDDMDRHVAALARGMLRLGVKKGDRVGVVLGNCSTYATLQWACARIGAIIVTINPAYKMSEMIGAMNLTEVSTLFISPSLRSSDYISLLRQALPNISSPSSSISDPALPSLRHLVLVDNITQRGSSKQAYLNAKSSIPAAIDFREILVWREDGSLKGDVDKLSDSLNNDDVVNLQFTSGTTGAPKAVSLTHRNLLNNGYSIGRCMNLTPKDRICNTATFLLSSTVLMSNLASWTHASTIVYSAESFNPQATVRALEQERCTGVHGVPTHFLGLISEVERVRKEEGREVDLSSLRTGIAAGSTIPIDLMRQLIGKLNLTELTIAYGMTETSPVSFQTIPSDPMEKRTETVGRVQPHVVAKIVNPRNEIVDVGQPGELCVSGYLAHKGYWNDPEHSAEIMKRDIDPDGKTVREWIYTGDEAILDEDGFLRIVGRLKDLIIRGGENLFPVQIENVVTEHPQIREAAAIAVPNAKFGEVVGLWLVREDSLAENEKRISPAAIREWVVGRMNPQNAPAYVWFFNEDPELERRGYVELPKTGSGKVQKNILRGWSRELAKDGIGSLSKP